jgi:hypothetical protein
MSTLLTSQNDFQDFLLDGNSDILKQILSTEKISGESRLQIYAEAYRARLHEALAYNYPGLHKYLGDEAFYLLAEAYLKNHPSNFRSIRWFGNQLDIFLQNHADYLDNPHWAEMAKFEWSMTLAFDAADSSILGIDDILQIPPSAWSHMQFHVHPSLQLINLSWNVISIWQALIDETETLPQLLHSDIKTTWIVWRKNFMTQFYALTTEETWALEALANRTSFGDICQGLCQWISEEQAGTQAASLLKSWVEAGLLSSVEWNHF